MHFRVNFYTLFYLLIWFQNEEDTEKGVYSLLISFLFGVKNEGWMGKNSGHLFSQVTSVIRRREFILGREASPRMPPVCKWYWKNRLKTRRKYAVPDPPYSAAPHIYVLFNINVTYSNSHLPPGKYKWDATPTSFPLWKSHRESVADVILNSQIFSCENKIIFYFARLLYRIGITVFR